MRTKKEIVAVVVLYNPDDQIYQIIKEYETLVNRVILVDNSSKSNKSKFKNLNFVKYIPLFQNKGIAYALNKGIKESDERYILTMDQDSHISKELIESYLFFLNKKDRKTIGALTCKYNTDRNPEMATSGSKKVKFSMQSGTLFKRSTFQKIGYFNENLFLDVVDYEFFLRMDHQHLDLIRVNSAVLNHQPAITKDLKLGFINIKYGIASPVRYYYQARNLLWTAQKFNSGKLYIILLIKVLKIIILFDNKREYLNAFNQGINDAVHDKLGPYRR